MKLAILYAVTTIVLPLALYAGVGAVVVPIWLVVPALSFALIVGGVIVFHQWLRLIGFALVRIAVLVVSLTLLTAALLAVQQAAAAGWLLWPLVVAGLAALIVAMWPAPTEARLQEQS